MTAPARPFRVLAALAATLALGGCVTAPKPLQGTWAALTPQTAAGQAAGTAVRWGGRLVEVRPAAASTCFDVIAQPLGANGAPTGGDTSLGRFRACRAGFYDPAVFAPNREVTFTGTLAGVDTVRIGEYDAQVPRIDADVVFLWPERRDVDVIVERSPWW